MHDAPAVSYPVARPVLMGLAAAGLWLLGAAVTAFWASAVDSAGWRQLAGAVAALLAGAWGLSAWRKSPVGELRWDGTQWQLPGARRTVRLDVALDLQQRLLLHWEGDGGSGWLWIERAQCPERWLDLRRAVYSRAMPKSLPPVPPAATP